MDETRIWDLKKTSIPVDCAVLGRAAADEATVAAGRILHHLLRLLGVGI